LNDRKATALAGEHASSFSFVSGLVRFVGNLNEKLPEWLKTL
jgi:hypothetical protein